nr:immunoglobulin light chain junction region [Macaca mulatta]MOW56551.1 immunoglobulin light chain junction region [Macaca mulatta]MOW56737.1 immunoglobulin light chain junction region [Macaca mulatta]MOW56820.1 immunoglobulin light chain junction region [Macaca mulatta]MOW57443.1 immunoglobulin light chain junction region [Macaca mulatta]
DYYCGSWDNSGNHVF